MLEKRGFDPSQLNRNVDLDFLRRQFKLLANGSKESIGPGVYSCDIFVKEPDDITSNYERRKAYVHFSIYPQETEMSLQKKLKVIKENYGLDPNRDDVAVVLFRDDMESDSIFYRLEKDDSLSIRVFHYKNLMFDITKHQLVPKHERINDMEKIQLKKDLKLTHYNQLPTLLASDPVARFYHYRRGYVIRIERPSVGNMRHIAYRYVV
jgi:DNA-directed RNA polymerase subunit H (RpoH/RPB5)